VEAEQREIRLQVLRRLLRLNAFAVPVVVVGLVVIAVSGGAPVWLWVLFAVAVGTWAFGAIGLMRSFRRERKAGH
jgi:uncharacterized membrane protein YecN with MAPEG domain